MKNYSKDYYTCPYCLKRYKGILPKNGDGSVYIFPLHKTNKLPFKMVTVVCRGSHEEVKDEIWKEAEC